MRSPHLDKDWLYQKYITENLSTYQIGAIVNRDPKRIYEKLKDFGIPTRPRGENLKKGVNSACYMLSNNTNPFAGKSHSEQTRKALSEKASRPKPYLRGKRNGMSGRTGTSNPNYRGGTSPERQRLYASGEWKELVRQVYARDRYTCQRCGESHTSRNKLHAHHIKTWAEYPALRFEISNLITLCNHCHNWVHSSGNTDQLFLG
jgi:hypothetical protein